MKINPDRQFLLLRRWPYDYRHTSIPITYRAKHALCLWLRYFVLLSDGIGDMEVRARERAEAIKARFVDARLIHFIECECGEVLTFVDEVSGMVM